MEFRITSSAGVDMGTFEAPTPEAAILAMHRAAGYGPEAVTLRGRALIAGPAWDEAFGAVDIRDEGGRVVEVG